MLRGEKLRAVRLKVVEVVEGAKAETMLDGVHTEEEEVVVEGEVKKWLVDERKREEAAAAEEVEGVRSKRRRKEVVELQTAVEGRRLRKGEWSSLPWLRSRFLPPGRIPKAQVPPWEQAEEVVEEREA